MQMNSTNAVVKMLCSVQCSPLYPELLPLRQDTKTQVTFGRCNYKYMVLQKGRRDS